MSFAERLKQGAPLRIGELARYIGYSRYQVYKWIEADQIKTVRLVDGGDRRIPVAEAERIARILQIPGLPASTVLIVVNTVNN